MVKKIHEQPYWVQNHPTVPVFYQPKNNQVSWYFFHDKDLDSNLIFIGGMETYFSVHLTTSLIP